MTTAVADQEVGRRGEPEGVRPRWRLLLALGWLVVLAAMVLTGERPTSFHDLEHAVEAGRVHEVSVDGGLGRHDRGFSTVTVRWREGLVRRRAEAVQARPLHRAQAERWRDEGRTVLTGDVAQRLTRLQPGLQVERVDVSDAGVHSSLLGWSLGGWPVALEVALWISTLVGLILSPEPWRATRWAWFWLVGGAGSVGVPAYLLLSGPTPLLPTPRRGAWRLSGLVALLAVWAFHVVLDAT